MATHINQYNVNKHNSKDKKKTLFFTLTTMGRKKIAHRKKSIQPKKHSLPQNEKKKETKEDTKKQKPEIY